MKEATFDPAKKLKLYFRCNRTGSKVFVFVYSDESPYSLIYEDVELNIYRNAGDKKKLIELSVSFSSNRVTTSITSTQSNVNEGEYYWELYRPDLGKTWLTGPAIFHNGEFDGVESDTETITVNENGEDVLITVTSEGITQAELDAALAPIESDIEDIQEELDNLSGGNGIFVDAYGAVGDGVTDDTQAIIDAVDANPDNVIIFSPSKTYLVSNAIPLYPGTVFNGYGAKILKADEVYTTLVTTASASASPQTVTVVDASIFAVNDSIAVLDVNASGGGAKNLEGSDLGAYISAINGNDITITGVLGVPQNGTVTTTYAIGCKVIKIFSLFSYGGGDVKEKPNAFYGLEIDGNRDNNLSTHDWRYNSMVRTPMYGSVFRDCIFRNGQAETLILSTDQIVDNCRFFDINGSCTHIGNGSFNTDSDKGNVRFINNTCRNVCELASESGNHAEGVVTVSTGVDKIYISGNYVDTGGSALYARTSAWAGNLEAETFIFNNRCYNLESVFEGLSTQQINKNVHIQDNFFDSCRVLLSLSAAANDSRLSRGWGYDNWVITGNSFINTKAFFRYCTNLLIENNTFITEDGFVYDDFMLSVYGQASIFGTLTIANSANYQVKNNNFHNKSLTYDSLNFYAIVCDQSDIENVATLPNKLVLIKANPYAVTEYAYANRNSSVEGNTIVNYSIGISDWITYDSAGIIPVNQIRRFKWQGLTLKNNIIQLSVDGTANYGIIAGPGCSVTGNEIYGLNGIGIYVLGVNNGAGTEYTDTTLKDRLNGPLVERNTIIGLTTSIQVGNSSTAARGMNSYNARVTNNNIDIAVTDNTGGNSTVSSNNTIINEYVQIFQLRENPDYYNTTEGVWNAQVEAWRAAGIAAGGPVLTNAFLGALSQMLDQMTTAGLLSNVLSMHVLGEGSKVYAIRNIINPASRQWTEVNTVTFTQRAGCKSGGTSYFNQPLVSNEFAGNALTVVQYVATSNASAANQSSHGMRIGTTAQYLMLRPFRVTPSNTGAALHYDAGNSFTNTNHKGLYIHTHNGTDNLIWKDWALDQTAATLIANSQTNNRFVLARNNNTVAEEFYTSSDVYFDMVVNDSWDATDVAAFRTIWEYFTQTLALP